ncbi:hypothetical protein K443DRAFT_680696 [Laccaria amethystina LaAM-08-1]|uniref:Protein ROT1 n=1 Tax=Laccaria amethystina LaAM-08-1 TaxID=1095629 RepID=A0A0C9XAQ9_9AGAR|nr:hypothetical protein K443DRAFT_680696 [Laccaria amethystina LaAM-08-1]
MLPHLSTLFALLGFHVALALHNVPIDDSDASVVYSGNWNIVLPGHGKAVNHTYKTAKDDSQAYATVKFTGVAVYYMSQKWPFHVTTDITLDDGPAVLLDLQEYGKTGRIPEEDSGQAIFIASATGLENREHTVRISVGTGEQYAVMDTLIYTALDASDSYSATSPPPTSFSQLGITTPATTTATHPTVHPSPSASVSNSKSTKTLKLAIGFGVAAAVLAFLTVFIVWRYLRPLPSPHTQAKLENDEA